MGIQTLVKKIKTKKGMKKAEKAGETLKEKGVDISTTPKTTTGSYVTSQGEVSVNKKGGINVVKPSTPSSGGKAQSSNQINTLQPSSQNQVSEQVQTKSTPISIKSSGAVKVGEREYTGNAYIPELQKTANQVQNETRLQVNQARPQSSLPIGQGRYSSQGEIVETRYQQSQIPATQQMGRSENTLSNLSVDFPALDFSENENLPKWGSTALDYGTQDKNMNVYLPGTVYAYQTGEYKGTPVFTTKVALEPGKGERLATSEELKLVFPSEVRAATTKEMKGLTTVGKVKGKITNFSNKDWQPGVYTEKKITTWSSKGNNTRQFLGGVATGIIPSTKGGVIKDVATFGVGGVVGAGIKGGAIGLSKVPKVGKYLTPVFKAGTTGAGIYFTGAYATKTASQIYFEKDYYQKGQITGSSIKEFSLLSTGFAGGSKGAEKVYGLIKTRGRVEIPLERLTRKEVISGQESFPTAPPQTHIELFKQTTVRLPELTQGTPGGFHVTPEKFWTSSKGITPNAGTSELPGLYVSSEASIHFSGLTNKGGYSLFNVPTLKDLTSGENPAIAFLKPKGFRETGFRKVNTYEIDKQKFKFDFGKPVKEGYIDIPGMKTEIEGIARVNAGSYSFESGKYYTTIKGVRTPIDVFKTDVLNVKLERGRGKSGKSLSSESYGSLPKSSALFNVRSLYYPSSSLPKSSLSRLSYSKSSKTSSFLSSKLYSRSYLSSSALSKVSYSRYSFNKSSRYSGTSYSSSSKYSPSSYFSPSKSKTSYPNFKYTSQSKSSGIIPVFGRRFGKFKIIGYGKNEQQAIGIGQDFAKKTLGATFKVPGAKTEYLPGYKTKFSKKEGKVFIQLPKYRLSSGSEKSEIQMFNRLKGGKRRK
jgi:hypothetical protein